VNKRGRLRWLAKYFSDLYLDQITRDYCRKIWEIKKKEASIATANRHFEVVRTILRRAFEEWEWIDKAPKIYMGTQPKGVIRFLTKDQAVRLLDELPEHLSDMVEFSLLTGLRKSNVTGLTWSTVDLGRRMAWVESIQSKNGESFAVPLNDEAISVIRRQIGKQDEFVFTYKGNPVTQVNTKAFRSALKRAGIVNFRWHDLRHTWASWHLQNGTPEAALKEMGAWKTDAMVRRYGHYGGSHLLIHAQGLQIRPELVRNLRAVN
jgi:integrase